MFIQDLIFGRRMPLAGKSTPVPEPVTPVPGFAEAAMAEMVDPPTQTEVLAVGRRAPVANPWSEPLPISADLSESDRQALILEEIARAHSPRIVSLQAADWLIELVVANRRLMAARIDSPEGQEMHDLRQSDQDEARAVALCGALAARIAEPVDLAVTSRHGRGVYAANGGLPTQLVFAGEAAIRTAHRPPELAETA